MNSEDKTVEYKKKPYKVLYRGVTKYGDRAHLASLDGKLDFWVNSDLIAGNKQSDSAEEDLFDPDPQPRMASCPDPGLANQIVSAGARELGRQHHDPKAMALINIAADWLRERVRE